MAQPRAIYEVPRARLSVQAYKRRYTDAKLQSALHSGWVVLLQLEINCWIREKSRWLTRSSRDERKTFFIICMNRLFAFAPHFSEEI